MGGGAPPVATAIDDAPASVAPRSLGPSAKDRQKLVYNPRTFTLVRACSCPAAL